MIFSDKDIYEAVKYHLPTVNEYVQSHGGAIKLLGTYNGIVYIELTGACHGYAMSLMTTKMAVVSHLKDFMKINNEQDKMEKFIPFIQDYVIQVKSLKSYGVIIK